MEVGGSETSQAQVLWMHYHIPKTGGTSFGTHLRSMASNDGRYLSVTMREQPNSLTPAQIEALPPENFSRIEIVQGHGVGRYLLKVMPRPIVREIFILRSPADRLVSHYNFTYRDALEEEVPSFDEHCSKVAPDFSLRFLAQRLGYRMDQWVLDRVLSDMAMGYTFTVNGLDEAAPLLCAAMGYQARPLSRLNVSGIQHPQRLILTPELESRLNHLNRLDDELFQAARYFEGTSIERIQAILTGDES